MEGSKALVDNSPTINQSSLKICQSYDQLVDHSSNCKYHLNSILIAILMQEERKLAVKDDLFYYTHNNI